MQHIFRTAPPITYRDAILNPRASNRSPHPIPDPGLYRLPLSSEHASRRHVQSVVRDAHGNGGIGHADGPRSFCGARCTCFGWPEGTEAGTEWWEGYAEAIRMGYRVKRGWMAWTSKCSIHFDLRARACVVRHIASPHLSRRQRGEWDLEEGVNRTLKAPAPKRPAQRPLSFVPPTGHPWTADEHPRGEVRSQARTGHLERDPDRRAQISDGNSSNLKCRYRGAQFSSQPSCRARRMEGVEDWPHAPFTG